jgi:Tfp pilus assembly protein PilX
MKPGLPYFQLPHQIVFPRKKRRLGSGLVVALVTLLVVTSIMGSIMHALLTELRQTRQTAIAVQAQWLADAAVERAAARLLKEASYRGETWKAELPSNGITAGARSGNIEIRISTNDEKNATEIKVQANYPDDSPRRVLVERTIAISKPQINSPAGDARKETNP